MRCALGLVLLAGCQVVFPLEKAPPDASDDAGQPTRRRKITINNPTGTPHREFPVSITTRNDADLMMYASESGEDLRFVLGGSVQLAKEIVRFDKATGTLDAWVRIPDLQPGANEIHLEYGGARIESPGPVWDPALFTAVWHMSDGGQTETDRVADNQRQMIADSAADAPGTGAGIAGLARNYTTANHYLCASKELPVGTTEGVSFSVWLQFTTSIGAMVVPFHAGGISNRGLALVVHPLMIEATAHDGTNQIKADDAQAFAPSSRWYQLVGVVERGSMSTVRLYLDGVQVDESAPGTLDAVMTIGPCLGKPFSGFIDEARIYRGTLHPDWIRTEFLNLSARQGIVVIDDPQE